MDFGDIRHVAIIMDGNGRWARSRSRARTHGHRAGVTSVRETTTACAQAHLPFLTLYALSTENFQNRPRRELRVLMALLRRFMIDERSTLMDNGVRLKTIGRVEELPDRVVAEIRETERITANNGNMTLTLALNYGGRAELTDGMRRIAKKVQQGELDPAAIEEDTIAEHLYDADLPDVDLMIRTAGEMRISNFLLWQFSYGELFVTDILWPEFRPAELARALDSFRGRSRKFGGLLEGVDS